MEEKVNYPLTLRGSKRVAQIREDMPELFQLPVSLLCCSERDPPVLLSESHPR